MKPILELVRLEESEQGTFGVLKINKEVFCCTLEPKDEENAPSISSIPAQQYICRKYSSQRHPNTYEVTSVPDRTSVLFHKGNIDEHTQGCILLGQYFGKLRGDRAVLNSGETFDEFIRRMDNAEELHLTIIEVY